MRQTIFYNQCSVLFRKSYKLRRRGIRDFMIYRKTVILESRSEIFRESFLLLSSWNSYTFEPFIWQVLKNQHHFSSISQVSWAFRISFDWFQKSHKHIAYLTTHSTTLLSDLVKKLDKVIELFQRDELETLSISRLMRITLLHLLEMAFENWRKG